MGNHSIKALKPDQLAKLKEKFSTLEIQILWLIYQDLSARDYGTVSKETFLRFFPLTGLWGERLFERFDLNHTSSITFYEFVNGIGLCCKSSDPDKIRLLFSLYDFDNDGFIEKKEMITMLYNYPKNHIKFITDEIAPDGGEKLEQVTEAKRIASVANVDLMDDGNDGNALGPIINSPPGNDSIMDDNGKEHIKGSAHKHHHHHDGELDPVADEDKKLDQLFPVERQISKSYMFYKGEEERKRMESGIVSLQIATKRVQNAENENAGTPRKGSKLGVLNLDVGSAQRRSRKYSGEVPAIKPTRITSNIGNAPSPGLRVSAAASRVSGSTVINDASFVQATTINTRVKEYASFMFKTFEGANIRGKISFEEFKEWIGMHPVILKIFDDSFHQDVWCLAKISDPNTLLPNNLTRQSTSQALEKPENIKNFSLHQSNPDIAGPLIRRGKKMKGWKNKYYELKGDFLYQYSKPTSKLPKAIFFLEGCYVEEMNDFAQTNKYGFKILYKGDSYEPHYLYTTNKAVFDDWMNHLRSYTSTSIQDRYILEDKIGTGKFSIVYKAVSKRDNKSEVAVKVIDKGGLRPEEREFVLTETTVMKVINHPRVIKLFETLETKNTIYIITELVKDGDLFEYIVTREFLEEYEASYVMQQLFDAFGYMQSVEIIHRDIKPENIMIALTEDKTKIKEVKIIDFGFAKFVTPGGILKETCGTPNYVAPEVLRGLGYDKRADIWSLGIIMFLMLRGRLPFDSHSVDEILRNTLRAELPMDEDHWDYVSPEGKDLLLKLLTKDVTKRITIADALKHPWITKRETLKKYIGGNRRPDNQSSSQLENE